MSITLILGLLVGCGSDIETSTEQTAAAETVSETSVDTTKDIEKNETTDTSTEENQATSQPTEAAQPTLSAAQKAAEEGSHRVVEVITLINVKNNNTIDDAGKRSHMVYLPPSYYDNEDRYPVVYYFHGFNQSPLEIDNIQLAARNLMEEGVIQEMIIVGVNCGNALGGSFLADSPVTGYWEKAFINELIPYIDGNYRTIASKNSRGLSGFSMGGYITVKTALNNPDYFNACYGMGPGLLRAEDMDVAMGSWSDQFKEAYGSAFAPEPDRNPSYLVPTLSGSDSDNQVIDRWLDGFGHLEEKIDDYLANKDQLAGFGLEVADNDMFTWITSGTLAFSDILEQKGYEHTLVVNHNGHTLTSDMFADNAMVFLDKYLEGYVAPEAEATTE